MSHYHPSIYRWSEPVPSYWETNAPAFEGGTSLNTGETCDVAVIGGGYTGLSAAYHLSKDSQLDVRVLEAGQIAWGASGRNGGFCSLHPSKLGYHDLLKKFGEDDARAYIRSQVEAVEEVRDLLITNSIEADIQGDGVYDVAHSERAFRDLEEEAALLTRVFDLPTRLVGRAAFAETVHASSEQFGALWKGVGFGLHPLKFARGLAALAEKAGAKLHAHTRVEGWEKDGAVHILRTPSGLLRAGRVIVATNGFTQDSLHSAFSGRLMPVLSNIITTRPLSQSELAAQNWRTQNPCANTRNLLFYYRLLPDNRLLFGARGDVSGHPETGKKHFEWMKRRFGEVFPAWQAIEITHFWRGLVCMTGRMTPIVGSLVDDPTVFYGLAYHGDGVAAAPWTGRQLANLVAGRATPASLPKLMTAMPGSIPFPALRRWYLSIALAYYRMKDRS